MKRSLYVFLALVMAVGLTGCALKTETHVRFGDRWIYKAGLSEETLEWLHWYNRLPREEQLAISAVPADLWQASGISAAEDAEATTE